MNRSHDAIAFLHGWQPAGAWHLASIVPDGKVTVRTFLGGEREALEKWLEERQGRENIYFHVNRLASNVRNRKAKKPDVELALGFHVDVDDLGVLPALQKFSPPPTAIICSGGGYQAFWKLAEPSAELKAVEAINEGLAARLGGDHCHNIDRIMRLPGTTNVPNRKKRDKGRTNSLAYIVDAQWDRTVTLTDFASAIGAATLPMSTPVAQYIDPLLDSISEFTKSLIVAGDDPARARGTPNARYRSRSEVLFRVVCDLVRANWTDESISSAIRNPGHRISDSVLEKRDSAGYAAHQIASAREKCGDTWPDVTRGGRPKGTYPNTLLAIRRLEVSTTYDSFHKRMFVAGHVLQSYQGELTDHAAARLRQVVLQQFRFDAGKDNIRDALHTLCLENQFHPILTYLNGIKWDGIERLPGFLSTYSGAEDTPLNRAIGQIVLIAAVRRVRHPGIKFDTILVLEGPQGTGKSTLICILAGRENFSDQNILALDAKAQMEALEGVWLYELSELQGLSKADTAKIKAFASRTEDRNRPAYARWRENQSRETVFIGTTNDDQYLTDHTGNRRFWPVRCGTIDLTALQRDRDQLWAEAAAKEASGASIQLPRDLWAVAAQEQEQRMVDDGWFDLLAKVKGEQHGDNFRVSSSHLLTHVLDIPKDRVTPAANKRVMAIMRRLGWTGPKLLRFEIGSPARGYERSDVRIEGEDPAI